MGSFVVISWDAWRGSGLLAFAGLAEPGCCPNPGGVLGAEDPPMSVDSPVLQILGIPGRVGREV